MFARAFLVVFKDVITCLIGKVKLISFGLKLLHAGIFAKS